MHRCNNYHDVSSVSYCVGFLLLHLLGGQAGSSELRDGIKKARLDCRLGRQCKNEPICVDFHAR